MTPTTLVVAARAANERLDVYLAATLGLTRSQAGRLVQTGAVRVNAAPAKPSYQVTSGDRIEVHLPQPVTADHNPPPELPVVYEDDELLVIDKPAGLTIHAGNGRRGEGTVADFARAHTSDPDTERPGIVHRLDRETSGLMVIAKTAGAKTALQHLFATRAVHKTYLALAVGRIKPANAIIQLPLDRDPKHPLRRAVVPGGRPAVTRYRTLAALPGYTYLELKPETGRTHQIRVHLAALGHPIAADLTYGSGQRILGLTRHWLHASRLSFTTPAGQPLDLISPLPPDLDKSLRSLQAQV